MSFLFSPLGRPELALDSTGVAFLNFHLFIRPPGGLRSESDFRFISIFAPEKRGGMLSAALAMKRKTAGRRKFLWHLVQRGNNELSSSSCNYTARHTRTSSRSRGHRFRCRLRCFPVDKKNNNNSREKGICGVKHDSTRVELRFTPPLHFPTES